PHGAFLWRFACLNEACERRQKARWKMRAAPQKAGVIMRSENDRDRIGAGEMFRRALRASPLRAAVLDFSRRAANGAMQMASVPVEKPARLANDRHVLAGQYECRFA